MQLGSGFLNDKWQNTKKIPVQWWVDTYFKKPNQVLGNSKTLEEGSGTKSIADPPSSGWCLKVLQSDESSRVNEDTAKVWCMGYTENRVSYDLKEKTES